MLKWVSRKEEQTYKPRWANSILAYNHNFKKCTYPNCERIIADGQWFKIVKENGHFFTFDSEFCEVAFNKRYGPNPES